MTSTAAREAGAEPVELVIFDCDGVLVDSERLAVRIESQLVASFGWPITEAEVIERFVGRSEADVLSDIESVLGRELPEWEALYEQRLYDAFRSELAPVPGVVEALDELRFPACVASSGSHDKMQLTLGLTGLFERFEGRIFSATEVAKSKPAPDLFLHAAAKMGAAPSRCVVVEDSRPGVEASRAAGMRCLGYAGGVTSASSLAGPGTVVFDRMTDLAAVIAAIS